MSSIADSQISSSLANLAAASITHPFGLPKDPHQLNSSIFINPINLINSTVYLLNAADRIFSYKSIGNDDELDLGLKIWNILQRKSEFGKVPAITRFDIRNGAINGVLGYLNSNAKDNQHHQVHSVVAPGSALTFMRSTLSQYDNKLPLYFQLAALNYDESSSSLVPDYITPLTIASELQYTVFTPLSASEAQHLTLLSLVFSNLSTSINLFDGLNFTRESLRIENVLDSKQLRNVHDRLNSAVKLWESLPFEKRPTAALSTLNSILGTDYKPYQYYGHKQASTVFVIYGTVESELFINEIVTKFIKKLNLQIGVIAVRVPLPFDSEEFVNQIPESTKSLVVIGQSLDKKSSILKTNVAAACFFNGLATKLRVLEFIYSPTFIWSPIAVEQIVASFVKFPEEALSTLNSNKTLLPSGDFIFWTLDNSKYIEVASKLAHAFSLDEESFVKFRSKFDNFVSGGVYQAQLSANSSSIGAIDNANIVVVDDLSILENFNIIKTLQKDNGVVILVQPELPSDLKEFTEKLPLKFRQDLALNNNKLVLVDLAAIGEHAQTKGRTGSIAIQAVFWRYAASELSVNDIGRRVHNAFGSDIELLAAVINSIIDEIFAKAIKEIIVDPKWSEAVSNETTDDAAPKTLPIFPIESSFTANPRTHQVPAQNEVTSKIETIKRFAFKESFRASNELRPDLPVRNFIVKVQQNRRVTPFDYSRNVFHIEFDITGTGLTYDIGEALGVHGRNDPEEVERFLEFYGLDPDELVQVPNRDQNELIEIRTVFQTFTENLDLLGKPPKRFYESLAQFAQDENEKKKLELLGSAEGAVQLKKFQDEEFYSYSDILELFPSAKPSLAELVSLIPTLKRREYSIASSQKMHPNAVHLLIVVVDWVDKRNRKRFGQCSHYLSELPIGSELIVSVKPSVMKLPPLSTQPIVMSGLGTGLAPFKAFVEEKVWQKQQGMEIGEIYLYLGARHRKEEYLYGELWEAYKNAGIITHIGAAFSRDQPEKIYIQDRIRQTLPELKEAIIKKNGSFYLCGPTWPVPDITASLEDIVAEEAKERGVEVDAAKEVEEMKENSRYVLEVY